MLPISEWNAFDFIYPLSFFCHTVLQSVSNAWRMRWTAREKSPTTQVRDARLAAAAKPAAGMKWSQVTVHPESQPHTNTHTHIYSHSLTLWGCGWRASDRICCVCVCLCILWCVLVVGRQQLCGDYFCFFFFFFFWGRGFSISDPSLRVWHFGDGTLKLKWHLICFSFLKIYSACPPSVHLRS